MNSISQIARTGICAALVLALSACASIRERLPEIVERDAEPVAAVAEPARPEAPVAVTAEEFLARARSVGPPERQDYQLRAVAAMIRAGRVGMAERQLAGIDVSGLPQVFTARKILLRSEVALHRQQTTDAMRLLNRLLPMRGLDRDLSARIYRVRAQAQLALNQNVSAVRDLIRRETFLSEPRAIQQNHQELWRILEATNPATLRNERFISADPVYKGWLDLAVITIEYAADPQRLNEELQRWQRAYPTHPASDSLAPTLSTFASPSLAPVDRITLLLPLSSRFGVAAQAVHDGFLALHAANTHTYKPSITVVDIGEDPTLIGAYYRSAVAQGAQMIIGPLGRDAAQTLVDTEPLAVPTLLLSYVNETMALPSHVYQFGLLPEDEARAAATRAFFDGHRRVAILYPETPRGTRIQQAFRDHLETLGGHIIEAQAYYPSEADHSLAIRYLLNLDASTTRKNRLENVLKTDVKFQARRRQDVDCIFLIADAEQGRLLKPQLNFYHALDLPVYATSDIFSGSPNELHDRDLNGVIFGDSPWLLAREGRIPALRQSVQGDWPKQRTQLDRLYALGMDAYWIAPQLERLTRDAVVFSGVTGDLSMDRGGRIHRQLYWARFVRGLPVPMDAYYNPVGRMEFDSATEASPTPDPRAGRGAGRL